MLKIRLQRVGRKHEPTFRVVLTDSKNSTKSGKYLEVLGHYDPRRESDEMNAERIKYWISVGAQLSGTVHNLLVDKKIVECKKINVLPRKTPVKKEEKPQGQTEATSDDSGKEKKVSEKVEPGEEETGKKENAPAPSDSSEVKGEQEEKPTPENNV